MTRRSIAVIGAGFCGTMILHHLMQRDSLPLLDIHVYDQNGAHGRGVAYSTPFPEHLLNVPAAGMSAIPDCADDFIRFIGTDADPDRFYPRKIYGDYLSGFLVGAQQRAAEQGHRITLHSTPAPVAGGYDITVLATGTSQPVCPPGGGRIITHPYGAEFAALMNNPVNNLRAMTEIIILGTGLSAADAVVSLHRAGYAGHITCISRHGLWPAVHGPKSKLWHWRKYVDGLRPHSNTIWRALPRGMRQFLLARVTFWNAIRHRMPPEIYADLKMLERTGRLITIKGHICSVAAPPQGREAGVEVHLRHAVIAGDLAVNCLGFIPYRQVPASGFRVGESTWTLGAPLFGHLIETTAVPELRVQAKQVADNIADFLQRSAA